MLPVREEPTVLNIPAGFSFADSLAQGVLDMATGAADPLALSDMLILLPSRRACRTLRDAFLRLSGGDALLLPRLQPIGDVEVDDVSLLLADDAGAEDILGIAPAVTRLQRQVLLARAIQVAGISASFDQAVALAQELGRFLDEVQTEGLSFAGLRDLVPDEYAGHWQKTLEFLKILTEVWPGILDSRGVIDFAERRNLLIRAQTRAWRQNPPQFPVIAAGSTGTVPAARELLGLVARLPRGMLVLPGLDAALDDDSWDVIGPDHPQANMKKLLEDIGVSRDAVKPFSFKSHAPVNTGRVRLLSESMRPAATTDRWRRLTPRDIPHTALDGFARIDCDTPQEEADVIALILREALETPGKTAALITPDRRLGRRVSLSLRRWGISIDDSGGQPLTEFPAGAFLMLAAEAAEEGLSPVTLLALLKHPVMAAAMPAEDLRKMVYLLDQLALRGPRPSPGFQGLRDAISQPPGPHAPPDAASRAAEQRQNLLQWLDRIEPAMAPFVQMMDGTAPVSFHGMLTAHLRMAEALAATTDMPGNRRLWAAEAGEAASTLMGDILTAAADIPPLDPRHYVTLLRNLLKSVTVRAQYGMHPRLSIMGQVEARLYCADLVILGGLNEGTWPDLPAHDPWMSRPMRQRFGLPAPEKSVSLSAHDFVQAAAAPEVIVTRAAKVDGTPTVPARWLLRMEAVLQAVGLQLNDTAAKKYRQWRQDMDRPAHPPKPVPRPEPRPPVAARPRQLSVTRIETWMRDPYQIYAQYVLGLKAFDPLEADPGGAERGTFIHAALEKFIQAFPKDLPENAAEHLRHFGRVALAEMRVPAEVEAFWWPRFEKIAALFVAQERGWRHTALPLRTETSGSWTFNAPAGPFRLTGKADRIDRRRDDGRYAIIDYKSGHAPRKSEVEQGLSPQLPLEALILEKGGFDGIAPGSMTAHLVYWKVTGSGRVPVEFVSLTDPDDGDDTAAALTAAAQEGLAALVAKFDDPATPYLSQPRTDAEPRFSDYEHLARVREWRVSGDDGEEAA